MPRFRPYEHLRRPGDFQLVYDQRQSVADGVLIVYARANGLGHSRVGLSVSKKFGGAVVRNRIRRLMRESFRLTKERIPPGFDFVLIPRAKTEYFLEPFLKSVEKLCVQATRRTPLGAKPPRAPEGNS